MTAGGTSFGDRLRQLRIAAGLTQETLAERAGLSVRAVSALERGDRRAPHRQTVDLLAGALGLDRAARAALAAAATRPRAASARVRDADAVQASSPSLARGSALAGSLRATFTSFVGRERDLAVAWLPIAEGTRLLTFTGPGGAGKTRLAIEGARTVRDHFPDGVWFVELAALASPELVAQSVAVTLGVHETADRSHAESLALAIADRRVLLILDNCEHLRTACTELVLTLLGACPRLTIVATSREPLGVAGEYVYPVPALAVPEGIGSDESGAGRSNPAGSLGSPRGSLDPREPAPAGRGGIPTPDSLRRYAAVELFVQRAAAARGGFTLTERNVAAVAAICRRLDGLPLAIELAAARVRALTPEQIAARLDDRFRLLAGGAGAAAPRHQTLRALLDWSHELLSPPEQVLLRRLAVFMGGWTVDAAEVICAGAGIDGADVLDLLTRLVDRSLVVAELQAEPPRYRLMESIRAYAAEELEHAGEAAVVRARHRDWYAGQAEAGPGTAGRPAEAAWLAEMAIEHGNLRAAFEWSLGRGGDAEAALRLGVVLWEFWTARHLVREGRDWHTRALAATGQAAPVIRARAQAQMSILFLLAGDYDAGIVAARQALALATAPGDAAIVVQAQRGMALCLAARGEYAPARQLLERALEQARALGAPRPLALVLSNLGFVALEQAELDQARQWLREAVTVARIAGDAVEGAFGLAMLGSCALEGGDLAQARAWYGEGLMLATASDHQRNASYCLLGLAELAAREGRWDRAARLLAIWDEVCVRHGLAPSPSEREAADWLRREVEATVDAGTLASARAMGQAATFDEGVRYALDETSEPPATHGPSA